MVTTQDLSRAIRRYSECLKAKASYSAFTIAACLSELPESARHASDLTDQELGSMIARGAFDLTAMRDKARDEARRLLRILNAAGNFEPEELVHCILLRIEVESVERLLSRLGYLDSKGTTDLAVADRALRKVARSKRGRDALTAAVRTIRRNEPTLRYSSGMKFALSLV